MRVQCNAISSLLPFYNNYSLTCTRYLPLSDRTCTACSADQNYGLFLSNENPTLGQWLENGRTLDSYHFKPAKVCSLRISN